MMKVSERTVIFLASTIKIATSVVVMVAGGAHFNVPAFPVCKAISVMITVVSVAPAGTRWMSIGSVSPVVSHMIKIGRAHV